MPDCRSRVFSETTLAALRLVTTRSRHRGIEPRHCRLSLNWSDAGTRPRNRGREETETEGEASCFLISCLKIDLKKSEKPGQCLVTWVQQPDRSFCFLLCNVCPVIVVSSWATEARLRVHPSRPTSEQLLDGLLYEILCRLSWSPEDEFYWRWLSPLSAPVGQSVSDSTR